jgi:hypothetical protein
LPSVRVEPAEGCRAAGSLVRDRGESFSSIAPFTLFPLPAEDLADGFIDIVFCLDLRALENTLAESGLEVDVARPPLSGGLFLTARRDEVTLTVPPHLREQMMLELMTPDALARALTIVRDDMEANRLTSIDSRIVVFEDEASVWDGIESGPRPAAPGRGRSMED